MFLFNSRCFLGLVFLAANVEVIAIPFFNFGSKNNQSNMWTETYLPYNGMDRDAFGNHGPYTADDPLRQHLNLYQHPSNTPTPVYFFSHSAGGSVASLNSQRLKIIASAGYSVISWESVSKIKTQDGFNTCVADFELLWSWFKDNAALYNLDPESVVIGGSSRGTICSWPMAYSQKPEIKGVYMNNALPGDKVWGPNAQQGSSTIWEEIITTNSPPAYLVFQPECPKPIQQNCVPSPDPRDIHNPKHGQTIVDRYTKLGIESRIKLTDGLANKGMNMFDLFPEFVASLPSNNENNDIDNTQAIPSNNEDDNNAQAIPSNNEENNNNQTIPSNNESTNISREQRLRRKIVKLTLRLLLALVLILLLLCWCRPGNPKSTTTKRNLDEPSEQKSNDDIEVGN